MPESVLTKLATHDQSPVATSGTPIRNPTPETIENAFLALDRANHTFEQKMNHEIEQRDKWEGAATVSATVDESGEKPVALVVQ